MAAVAEVGVVAVGLGGHDDSEPTVVDTIYFGAAPRPRSISRPACRRPDAVRERFRAGDVEISVESP